MAIASFIEQRGFRKWYERELLRSHAHLVLLLLCAMALLGAAEAFGPARGEQRLLMAGSFVVAAAIGVWAVRRYLFHLMRAELIANQAACPQCKAYARWRIEQRVHGADEGETGASMTVRCRACEHGWTIGW
jgi:hypothetical protein